MSSKLELRRLADGMRNNWILLLCAIALGFSWVVSPGATFLSIIVIVTLRYFYTRSTSNEASFLIKIFTATFLVRAVALFIISSMLIEQNRFFSFPGYPGVVPDLIGDGAYYTLRGYWMALHWQYVDLPQQILNSAFNPTYGWNTYTYLLAFYHYLFGFSPVSSALMNCVFGSLLCVVCYALARKIFSQAIAKMLAIFVAFFPSLILWSITNLKDTLLILVLYSILLTYVWCITIRGVKKLAFLCIIAVGLIAESSLRHQLMPLTLAGLVLAYFLGLPRPRFHIKIASVGVIIFVCWIFGIFSFTQIDLSFRRKMSSIFAIHQAAAIGAGSNYRILDDKYYILNKNYDFRKDSDEMWYLCQTSKLSYGEYGKSLMKGALHFLYEPLPWKTNTNLKSIAFPQMMLWYLITPFFLLGVLICLRYRPRDCTVLFVYMLVTVSGNALTLSNIGTAFRFRDMITPLYLLFSCVGIARLAGWPIFSERSA